jgi:sugar/nucleoside kinase (ribokinase family)
VIQNPGIAGIGCALLDILHPDASIESEAFERNRSRVPGDGGLVPGQLVLASALSEFSGKQVDEIVAEICGDSPPENNIGGPAIVALILAAQMLKPNGIPVRFFGVRGTDEIGKTLGRLVRKTPLLYDDYVVRDGTSPSTRVLSDPHAANGAGERTFINEIGVAAEFEPEEIPDVFFRYHVAFFGGTAVLPKIHANIGIPLRRAKQNGALTIVATVYDFINESKAPDKLWPLGADQKDYPAVDLMITDAEEARRLTGEAKPSAAVQRFLSWGTGAAVVTSGSVPVWFAVASDRKDGRFQPNRLESLPVSAEVRRRAPTVEPTTRDTTGCGDNFAGGILASIGTQLASFPCNAEGAPEGQVNLRDAIITGIAAGAAAWFQLGGTRFEAHPGESLRNVEGFRNAYLSQINELAL